ncbi:MAG TPA: type II toxin-antitoxin system VapC family toxin [Gemmataceae bacterium]|nr:type II toxin-antitoxin system VapC family toxin [Gemmataceae bacterium]
MIFTDLPAGARVFVDANTLVYHFSRHPRFGATCTDLMGRIERGELSGVTTTHILGETAHRLMTLEAITLLNWPAAGIGNRLRTHPAEVNRLSRFRQAIEEVVQSKLQIILTTANLVAAAVALSQQIGLLFNDALIVAVMQANGLTHLASHDADFDRVPSLTRYAPA